MRVFFGGEKSFGSGGTGSGLKFIGIALIVAMMVGEFAGEADGKFPVFQILEKCAGIADTAEGVEGAGTNLLGTQRLDSSAEDAETEQARGGGKDGIVLEFGDGGFGLRRGFGASENEDVRPLHGGNGFTQRACRKKELAAEGLRGVEEEDVGVAEEREVLKAVVEKEEVDFVFELFALREAIRADAELHFFLETEFHEFDFIAGAGGTSVTAREDGNTLPFREKFFGEPNHHGSFAGTADGEVADADDGAIEAPSLQVALFVKPDTETREIAIKHRERPKQQAQPRRKIHWEEPPRCLETSATARSRAPRLVSTSCFAELPMRSIFCGSLRR